MDVVFFGYVTREELKTRVACATLPGSWQSCDLEFPLALWVQGYDTVAESWFGRISRTAGDVNWAPLL